MKCIFEHQSCIGNVTDYVLDLGINPHVRHAPAYLKWNRNSVFRPNLFSTRCAQTLDRFRLLPCLCCLPPSHQQTVSVPALSDIPLSPWPPSRRAFLSTPLQVSCDPFHGHRITCFSVWPTASCRGHLRIQTKPSHLLTEIPAVDSY